MRRLPPKSATGRRLFAARAAVRSIKYSPRAIKIGEGQDPTQTTLYQQCLQMGLIARPESGAAEAIEAAAVPTLAAKGDDLDTTREAAFQIGGMWCASCAWLIEHALGQMKGVERSRVYFRV